MQSPPRFAIFAGLMALLMGTSLMGMSGVPASASSADASSLRYKNEGEYFASFEVRWKLGGQTCAAIALDDKGQIPMGNQTKIDLTAKVSLLRGEAKTCLVGGKIPEGTEVWGFVTIAAGPSNSCRKDKKVIFRSSGGMMKYYSKGYWQNNNRCRVEDWP